MTNLTTIEKFKFLSIESWLVDLVSRSDRSTKSCLGPSKSPGIRGESELSKEQTYEAALISCRSRSEE